MPVFGDNFIPNESPKETAFPSSWFSPGWNGKTGVTMLLYIWWKDCWKCAFLPACRKESLGWVHKGLQWGMVRRRPAKPTLLKLPRCFDRRSWPGARRLALARILKKHGIVFLKPLVFFPVCASQASLSPTHTCVCAHTHTPTKASLQPQTPDARINHDCSAASSHVTA